MHPAQRALLAHFVATLRYRTRKAIEKAGPSFGSSVPPGGARTPSEIVRHMTSVLGFACACFAGQRPRLDPLENLDAEMARLERVLNELQQHLASGTALREGVTAGRLLQGPLADAMTHAGQLAMLRRFAGDPIPPEDFFAADI